METLVFQDEEISPDGGKVDGGAWKDNVEKILSFLNHSKESFSLRGTHPTALSYLLAKGIKSLKRNFLLIAPTDREAEKYMEVIRFFWGKESSRADTPLAQRIWYFPSRTGRKIQSLGKMETTARRLETLYALRNASSPILVVTSALALMERLPLPEDLMKHAEYKVVGEEMDLESFSRKLVDCGYYGVSLVEEYGDFSRRGGVLDVYAPLYPWPIRLEFFGDELESIRLFHPSSQRSMGTLEDFILLPVSEIILNDAAKERARDAVYEDVNKENLTPSAGNVWLEKFQEGHQFGAFESVISIFYEKLGTLLDYLPSETLMVWSDDILVRKEMNEHYWKMARDWEGNRAGDEWKRPPEELFEVPERLLAAADAFRHIRVNSIEDQAAEVKRFDLGAGGHEDLVLTVKSHPNKERLLEPLALQFQKWQREGIIVFLVCHQKGQAKRMTELLTGYGVDALYSPFPFGEESYGAPAVKVIEGGLERGFFWPAERLAVIAEEEIFGRRSHRRSRKSLSGIFLNSFQDLHVDDYVVHVDHGIGLYKELVHLNVRGIESDFLLIHYQDADRLYVPVDKLQKVQKYLGVEGQEPRLDKLGGKSWDAAKKKAAESAERIAEELLNLYASREVKEGFRFSPPDSLFQEFETTFGYEETPDQLKAIDDVLEDMASARPMDRLICGDVGFGKTEVALRAAFKAVSDGKQVAMLVPTTILAEQHYQAFKERFEGFPVEVASLSRFKTTAQQKQVLEGLKKGTIDVVIGTHRLLQKDVVFRDLGLLIIDEEHRFGVKHKEKLKEFRVSVDVLTLTATPIPRTLQMSLSGMRDLSTIETPPQDRHSIETFMCKYDDLTIKEAIYRELARKGQVFFVHNHVQSIYQMANVLKQLVPEARLAVAHGQMKERELEKVMLDFIAQKVDVLVCTTIIESGLDIPAANTIIINRADKFGLAQIYQLRGRVGRSTEQAYAYLLVPGEDLISRDAQKRLRALMDFSELGAGFKIALNDLQIRGGGTILGSSQSGHIAAVGYELYLELLERTVKAMKGDKAESEPIDTEINVPLSAFLPVTFIPDTDQRLLAYKRLSTVVAEEDVDELVGEWRDRYGPFPDTARNLILLAKIRLLLKRFGIVRMDGGEETFTLHFTKDTDLQRVFFFLEEQKCTCQLEADRKLKMEIWGRNLPQRLARFKRILQELGKNASNIKLIQ
ncbi:transcription-repair coupling factor [Desulforhabdus amnigena]|uniref:Transcription-repair-coupling factor n=1 Tax=Desulforhabdus amnigena TaxID=40218 RepID=A0A9W6FW57_9BACT|nr:transcription-repair coupling factor [Desulforhabdus amnigena]NLJ26736.1 transcription-repair coupling factor [Deltaproteobacteria bacterium]GLI36006.1 transcription-repair-coupling factor [Desulforhabdus amnigena]